MSSAPRVRHPRPTVPASRCDAIYLRAWRHVAAISQAELAARAQLGVVTISRIECQQRGTVRSLVKLAQALNVSVAQLREQDPLRQQLPGPTTPTAA